MSLTVSRIFSHLSNQRGSRREGNKSDGMSEVIPHERGADREASAEQAGETAGG